MKKEFIPILLLFLICSFLAGANVVGLLAKASCTNICADQNMIIHHWNPQSGCVCAPNTEIKPKL